MAQRDSLDTVIDVIIAEAAGEGPRGMTAAAYTIWNRALYEGRMLDEIVTADNQFTAYKNPGRVVARDMQNPALRSQVRGILDGIQSGRITDPTGGADYYHTKDAPKKRWMGEYPETVTIGNHVFRRNPASKAQPLKSLERYVEGGRYVPTSIRTAAAQATTDTKFRGGKPTTDALAAIDTAAPQSLQERTLVGAGKGGAYDPARLEYATAGKRNLKVSPELESALTQSVAAVYGPGYWVQIYSGAQGEGSRGKTGTRRHGTKEAADVYVYGPDDKVLKGDDLVPLAQHWLGTGQGSVGFPKNGQSMHLDRVGGKGPGAVPFQGSVEFPVWYYGDEAPTPKQAQLRKDVARTGGTFTYSGSLPTYAVDPKTVTSYASTRGVGAVGQQAPTPEARLGRPLTVDALEDYAATKYTRRVDPDADVRSFVNANVDLGQRMAARDAGVRRETAEPATASKTVTGTPGRAVEASRAATIDPDTGRVVAADRGRPVAATIRELPDDVDEPRLGVQRRVAEAVVPMNVRRTAGTIVPGDGTAKLSPWARVEAARQVVQDRQEMVAPRYDPSMLDPRPIALRNVDMVVGDVGMKTALSARDVSRLDDAQRAQARRATATAAVVTPAETVQQSKVQTVNPSTGALVESPPVPVIQGAAGKAAKTSPIRQATGVVISDVAGATPAPRQNLTLKQVADDVTLSIDTLDKTFDLLGALGTTLTGKKEAPKESPLPQARIRRVDPIGTMPKFSELLGGGLTPSGTQQGTKRQAPTPLDPIRRQTTARPTTQQSTTLRPTTLRPANDRVPIDIVVNGGNVVRQQPRYVSESTGQTLTPRQVSRYNADTQSFEKVTVYRAAGSTPKTDGTAFDKAGSISIGAGL